MIHWFIANIVCSFFGTIAFAILFNVPRRFYLSCGLIGTFGWVVYCIAVPHTSMPIASFLGSFTVVLISRILTVPMKCPITMFLVPGIFPLIPGASIYYMAYDLVINDTEKAGESGFMALKIAFAIVFGIISVVSVPREVFSPGYWKKRQQNESKNLE